MTTIEWHEQTAGFFALSFVLVGNKYCNIYFSCLLWSCPRNAWKYAYKWNLGSVPYQNKLILYRKWKFIWYSVHEILQSKAAARVVITIKETKITLL